MQYPADAVWLEQHLPRSPESGPGTWLFGASWRMVIQKQSPEVFYKKDVLKNSAKFTGKLMCQSLFLNKVAGIRPATLIRKRLWHSCFPVNFAKYLRTPFLQNTPGRLLLVIAALRLYEIVQVSLFLLTWGTEKVNAKTRLWQRLIFG